MSDESFHREDGRNIHTAQEPKVVRERGLVRHGEVLADGTSEEEDKHDSGGDPEGPVQVRVTLEHVEEVGSGEEGGPASRQHRRGVDVEELRVEGYAP